MIAAWQGLSPKDWATTVQNIADYLPASVLASPQGQSLLLSGDDVHARVPRGCLSEMVSAAVIRFSSGARTALLQRLDRHHVSSVCRGHEPVCPPVKEPPDRPSRGCERLVSEKGFDLPRDGLVDIPGGTSLVWGLNSFAEMLVRRGLGNAWVGKQVGSRGPEMTGLSAVFGSGMWFAVVGRNAAVAVPGVSQSEEELPARAIRLGRRGPGRTAARVCAGVCRALGDGRRECS